MTRPAAEGRTAEQWADILVDNVSGATQLPTAAYAADYPDRPALHNEDEWRLNAVAIFGLAVRAAIAERDAVWSEAVRGSVREYHCELDETPCADCATIHALLDAAARSANKESPKNPTERTE